MKPSASLSVLLFLTAAVATRGADSGKRISLDSLKDKIAGGWAGQMIGVSYGAPTEFRSNGHINERELPKWTPDRVSNALQQDDLYVDMTFAKVLDDKGLDATTEDFGAMFRNARYRLWHANESGRRNLKRGISPAESGLPRYNAHANDIDFQIEADFIGLMAPGMYQPAIDLGLRAGRVMNYGDGIYGGIFVSCMYAAGFFEKDPRRVVESGLACIPAKSPYSMLISDVLQWSRQYPDDWKKVWHMLEDKWDRDDPCPEGALKPFNIDAKLNGAYIVLGLLYGKGDFGRTIDIATRSGQDSDCNPASAGGILGVMIGYKAIPDQWKSGIDALADQKFEYTDFSFHTIVASTYERTLALARRNGGTVSEDALLLKVRQPRPPRLEVWNPGKPVERIATTDARWKWNGEWSKAPLKTRDARPQDEQRRAATKGAEATVTFEGTGAIVTGPYLPDGGKLQAYLDGKPDRVLDVYSDETGTKNGDAVWHAFGLKNTKHTVRLVVLGEPYGSSSGSTVAIDTLIVYR